MSVKKKKTITYEVFTDDRMYKKTYISIYTRNRVSVDEMIQACAADPEYYGSKDIWVALKNDGNKYCYRDDFDRYNLTLDYLHYGNDGYCSHQIGEIRGGLRVMSWASKFLTRLSRQIAKSRGEYYGASENYSRELDSPQNVIDALKKMGAVHVERSAVGVHVGELVEVKSGCSLSKTKQAS